ncbi:MAG: hypothetical protein HQK51_16525 [Oligoflexia bacterium]|nr:hypothetical protein [Oligoflexia bacterium]
MITHVIFFPIMLLIFTFFMLYSTSNSKNYLNELPSIEKQSIQKLNLNKNQNRNEKGSGTLIGTTLLSLLAFMANIYSLTMEYKKTILEDHLQTILCHEYLVRISSLYIKEIFISENTPNYQKLIHNVFLQKIRDTKNAKNTNDFCKKNKNSSTFLLANLPFKISSNMTLIRNKFGFIELKNNTWSINTSTKYGNNIYSTTFNFIQKDYTYETKKIFKQNKFE